MTQLENGSEKKILRKELFALRMARLAEICGEEVSKNRIKTYYDILSKRLDDDSLNLACDILEVEFKGDYGVKFPTPAHFIDTLNRFCKADEDVFEELYLKLVETGGASNDQDFDRVVKIAGGRFNVCKWQGSEISYGKSNLKSQYLAIKKNRKSDMEMKAIENFSEKKFLENLGKEMVGEL